MDLLIEHYGADEGTINKCIEEVAKDKKVDPRDVRTIVTLNVYQPVFHLPQEIFEMIASKLEATTLLGLCSASREMRYRCGDTVWKTIYKRDIYKRKAFPGETWKRNYILLRLSPEKVAAGYECFSVILDNNVYTWGNNSLGELGRETEETSDYTPQKVEIPSISPPIQVSIGDHEMGVVLENGDVYIWGYHRFFNRDTKIGVTKVDISGVHRISMTHLYMGFVLKSGEVYIMGNTPWEIYSHLGEKPVRAHKEIDNAIDIKCGATNAAILTSDNKMYVIGDNTREQLSLVSEAKRGVEEYNELFMADFKEPVFKIITGYEFMGAIVGNSVWMWGRDDRNTLGDGTYGGGGSYKARLKDIKNPTFLACNTEGSSAAVTLDGKLYTWGKTPVAYQKFIPSHIEIPARVKKDVYQVARGSNGSTLILFKGGEVKVFPG